MSAADYLVGVEEYELAFVEDVLDDAPVDAQTVYKETINMSERAIAAEAAFRATSGGGGAPTGAAGGVLGGTYPNPSFASDMATQAELDAHVNDAAAAHAATAVAFTPAGTIAATTVQAAIEEVASEAAGGGMAATLFDANSILKADTDDTPEALVMGASTTLARLAAGDIVAATPTEMRTLLDVPTTGEAVLDTLFDANTVLAADSDNTPAALTMGASTILARLAAGNIKAASVAEIAALIGPELPGYQYNRVTITANATTTQTVEASATVLMTSGAVTPGAAVAVRVIVAGPSLINSTTQGTVLNIWRAIDGGAAVDLGRVAQRDAVGDRIPVYAEVQDTPGAGSIVYTVRGWVTGASTGTLVAGVGGAAAYVAASLRIVRV